MEFFEPSVFEDNRTVTPPRVRALELAPASARVALRPDPPSLDGGLCTFSNVQRNGRQAGVAAFEPLAVRWRAPLADTLLPDVVAFTPAVGAVVVGGEYRWESFTTDGAPLAAASRMSAPLLLDRARGLIMQEASGDVVYADAASGAEVGRATFYLGDTVKRSLFAVLGSSIVAAGTVRPKGGDRVLPSQKSVLERFEPGAASEDEEGVFSKQAGRVLVGPTRLLLAVADERFVAVATEDALDLFDLALDPVERFTGTFLPLTLSTGGGRIAMIVRTPAGHALWLISGDGLITDLPLGPPPGPDGYHPPLIGYDHRVYVPVADMIVVVHPEGTWLGTYPVARFVGAAIDAEDTLLVCDGNRLVAFRGDERGVLFSFGAETLRAAPVVTVTGEVLCVTDKALYCIGAHS